MWQFLLLPFFLQAILILFDEGYYHIKRGLPIWERIGHPIDTLSFLICLAFTLFIPYSENALKVYAALAGVSCLMVTKDEFIHKHHCPASENWLHACLFIIHPITLAACALLWQALNESSSFILIPFEKTPLVVSFLQVQAFLMFLFFLYQIIFWNFLWKNKAVTKH